MRAQKSGKKLDVPLLSIPLISVDFPFPIPLPIHPKDFSITMAKLLLVLSTVLLALTRAVNATVCPEGYSKFESEYVCIKICSGHR